MYGGSHEEHLAAVTASAKPNTPSHEAPFDAQRCAAAAFNAAGHSGATLDAAMATITSSSKKPNEEQRLFLEHFVARLKVEWLEKQQGTVSLGGGEPLLDVVHGYPGTGKSAVIAWMRSLMEEGLGWEHGVHFVCLAFQNAMAAQINGHTVHHWSGIPARNDDGNATGDRH